MGPDPDYPEGDPRYWRVECEDETIPLVEHMDLLKKKYLNLNWIPHIQKVRSWPRVYQWVSDEEYEGDANVGHFQFLNFQISAGCGLIRCTGIARHLFCTRVVRLL